MVMAVGWGWGLVSLVPSFLWGWLGPWRGVERRSWGRAETVAEYVGNLPERGLTDDRNGHQVISLMSQRVEKCTSTGSTALRRMLSPNEDTAPASRSNRRGGFRDRFHWTQKRTQVAGARC